MATMTFEVSVTTGGSTSLDIPSGRVASLAGYGAPTGGTPPLMFPKDQAYYWTHFWQENEQVASEELRQGQGQRFANAGDAIRALLSADE